MAHVNPVKIQELVAAIEFPSEKRGLVSNAISVGTDDNIIAIISKLPDHSYTSSSEISRAIDKL